MHYSQFTLHSINFNLYLSPQLLLSVFDVRLDEDYRHGNSHVAPQLVFFRFSLTACTHYSTYYKREM